MHGRAGDVLGHAGPLQGHAVVDAGTWREHTVIDKDELIRLATRPDVSMNPYRKAPDLGEEREPCMFDGFTFQRMLMDTFGQAYHLKLRLPCRRLVNVFMVSRNFVFQ